MEAIRKYSGGFSSGENRKDVVKLCRCKMGNPKKMSRFICCKCLKENQIGSGIQRSNQRSKYHIKDLTCINPGCNGDITKNIEVRYCDSFQEMMDKAEKLHIEYYGKVG